MVNYRELRCSHCHKLLAKGSGTVQIKCQRCKTVNQFSSLTTENAFEHPSEKGKYGCPNRNKPR